MNESQATRYQRTRRRAAAAGLISGAAVLAGVALTPAARTLYTWAAASASAAPATIRPAVAFSIFTIAVVALCEVAALPAATYLHARRRRGHGPAPPAIPRIAAEQLRGAAFAVVAAVVAGAMYRGALWMAGPWWPVPGALFIMIVLGSGLRIGPWLAARTGAVRPLPREALRESLYRLAVRARVPVDGIDEWVADSEARTAIVLGTGRHRRVLVSSELVRHWSDEEIEVVVAHELAHHAHHDLRRAAMLDAAVLCSSLWVAAGLVDTVGRWIGLEGSTDPVSWPFVALTSWAVWIAATPLRHAQSRRQEYRADEFALETTGAVDAFTAAIKRLGATHLAEERPSALTRVLFHRHPPVSERLALADRYRRMAPRLIAEARR